MLYLQRADAFSFPLKTFFNSSHPNAAPAVAGASKGINLSWTNWPGRLVH
jgi:hypothetical protein